MAQTTEQVGAVVRRRLLRTRYEWGLVLVQPAIVSVVTTSRNQEASAQIASASPLNEFANQAAGDTAII
jgi:hypothetical protein